MCFNYTPWTFSTYFTYFINYIHKGDSKLWYIIPPSEISKVEKLLKEQQNKISFQDHLSSSSSSSTSSHQIISPQFFLDHDIKIKSILQEKGEFLLIYPQSYYFSIDFGVSSCFIYIYIFIIIIIIITIIIYFYYIIN